MLLLQKHIQYLGHLIFAEGIQPLPEKLESMESVEFKWTPECENCFQILKEFLQQAPILKYPDLKASHTLLTDASKYAYAGVLTQHNNDTDHPITYVSGLFRGSQLNWATLTKEACAIYMSVKKQSKNNSEKRPPTIEEIPGKEHPKF